MLRSIPPFRADHVGSMLRPSYLRDARGKFAAGEIDAVALKTVEDRAIQEVVAKQEAIGLQAITDGEFRRAFWHLDFMEGLGGVESYQAEHGIKFQGGETKPKGLKVTSKLTAKAHPMVEHFNFLKAHTKETPKMIIPSPTVLHYRGGRKAVSESVYPTMEEFFNDLGRAFQGVVRQFVDAGCRYLQLDEVNYTYLCDPDQRQMLRDRGDDPEKLPGIYAEMINTSITGRPADMPITMHLCRGNFRSMWIAQGGYEPVAELLFNQVNVDGYFMEYDTERAGGFEPLRFVPKGKTVVLGIVTSKEGALESEDFLKRRIDDAAKFIDLDQLCLSPQCGFASTEEGNLITEEEQWAKLERVVTVAKQVWG
jgi:5-methyltetrahydropteroyltriglutamate--homocysteine methyltransferase